MLSPSLRDKLLFLHRWASLIGGVFLTVIALSGAVLSFAGPEPTGFMKQVLTLHTHLLADEPGEITVSITTVATLLIVLIGVLLWWDDKIWRVRMGASWKRIVFDLHHLLGIAFSLVLVIMVGTGTLIQLNEEEGEAAAAAVERVPESLRALHTGDFLGTPTRAIWFVGALVLAWQVVSGFLMWWNARAARKAAASG